MYLAFGTPFPYPKPLSFPSYRHAHLQKSFLANFVRVTRPSDFTTSLYKRHVVNGDLSIPELYNNFLGFFVLFCVQNLCCNDSKYHSLNWKEISVTNNVDIFEKKPFSLPFFYKPTSGYIHPKSERSVLALEIEPFRWVTYSLIFESNLAPLRWLDWIFWGWYLPSVSINYVGMSKDMEKRLPQLHYIKMKISYDLGFIAIGVAMAT